MKLQTTFPPAANLTNEYSYTLLPIPGINETLADPNNSSQGFNEMQIAPGLTLDRTGLIRGLATTKGIYQVPVTYVYPQGSVVFDVTLPVLDVIQLADQTIDQAQFVSQFVEVLSKTNTWSTGITSTTSQTLIELVSAVATFSTAKSVRIKEDAFPETAQSDAALRAIANMQGLRLTRKLPAQILVEFSPSPGTLIEPFTKMTAGGLSWFTQEPITLLNTPVQVYLKEGQVERTTVQGLGTDLQAWVSTPQGFTVSDQDVFVSVNSDTLEKTYGGLWNYKDRSACADTTLSDGRAVIQFGRSGFGKVPQVNETVTITYAVTKGAEVNNAAIEGVKLSVVGLPLVEAVVMTPPVGGADERNPMDYKNYAAGSFGTYASAVTSGQYDSIAKSYPGVKDAIIKAQRTINPFDLRWMNVMQVSVLLDGGMVWTEPQRKAYIDYLQKISMYSTRFLLSDPIRVPVDISLDVYCYNSAISLSSVKTSVTNAVKQLFAPRPGILGTSFHHSDIIETVMNSSPGDISYVLVKSPAGSTLVEPPVVSATSSVVRGGYLQAGTYAYAVTATLPSPENPNQTVTSPPSRWMYQQVTNDSSIVIKWGSLVGAITYTVWGRDGDKLQILAIINPNDPLEFVDDGSIPDPTQPMQFVTEAPKVRYAAINNEPVVNVFYTDRMTKATYPIRDVLK